MENNKTSIFERLKICWYVLTKKYYLYFGLDKDAIVWDKEGKYLNLKESSVKALIYISKDYQFLAYDKKTNLHDFVLKVIVKFINTKLIKVKKEEKYEIPNVSKTEDVSVTSRMAMIDNDLKPIAEFILDYASWNLHKDEWNHPVLEVPLFRVLDALIQRGKPYCGKN